MEKRNLNAGEKIGFGIGCGIPLVIFAGISFAIPLMFLFGSEGFVISFIIFAILGIAILASTKVNKS